MKKILILIVFTFVYFHFYPNPELNNWLGEKKENVIKVFSDATSTQVKLKSTKIYADLEAEFTSFSAKEITYLREITIDTASVKVFYSKYCVKKQYNANFHIINLTKVCSAITRYQNLL